MSTARAPRPVNQPHTLALALWLLMVALKLLQWRQRLRERGGEALGRAFSAELRRRLSTSGQGAGSSGR